MANLPGDSEPDKPTDRITEFLDLYSKFYPRLQFYLMALLPTANDAADVLQETSLILWKQFHSYQSGTNFYAWACKVARLQALKYRERMGRSAKLLDEAVLEKLAEQAAAEDFDPSATMEALVVCLDHLSERDRSLISRRYQPNISVKELAAEIGRSANALSKLLGKIRRVLLECVEQRLASMSRK